MTFAFVYISEAHATDEWPVGHNVEVKQPKTTSDRIALAEEKLAELGVGDEFIRLVDLIDNNSFHNAYACWPIRWYTVEPNSRRLSTIAQPRCSGYEMKELISWIVSKTVC